MARNMKDKIKIGGHGMSPSQAVPAAVLADLFDLTPRRLGQLAQMGMPKDGRGTYPLRDALRWYVEFLRGRQESQVASGPTRAEIERDIALLKLKKAQGQVFDRAEVVDTMTGAYVRLGNELELLATRVGRELNLPGDDVTMIRDMVDEMRIKFVHDSAEYVEVVEAPTSQTRVISFENARTSK
jgi:hypothetical protein